MATGEQKRSESGVDETPKPDAAGRRGSRGVGRPSNEEVQREFAALPGRRKRPAGADLLGPQDGLTERQRRILEIIRDTIE